MVTNKIIESEDKLRVINIGLDGFAKDMRQQDVSVVDVDWYPPADGDPNLNEILKTINFDQDLLKRINNANKMVIERVKNANPQVVDIISAEEALELPIHTILHSGPPIEWDRMCGPQKRAVLGAIQFEGWADDEDGAITLLKKEKITLLPCYQYDAVGPMTGIISPSMPVLVTKNEPYGNYGFSTFNEGRGNTLWFGIYDMGTLDRLKWIRDTLGPAMKAAVKIHEPINVFDIVEQGLQMGDECHARHAASTALLIKQLIPSMLDAGVSGKKVSSIIRFMNENSHFFLNFTLSAVKVTMDSAHNIPFSTIVTGMSRNGVDFMLRVSGLGENYIVGPVSSMDNAVYYTGFTVEDAAGDIGDSAITETCGLGGMAIASAPSLAPFVGGSLSDEIESIQKLNSITLDTHHRFKMPTMDMENTPLGIDILRVVETRIVPFITTGVLHETSPVVGQIGTGVSNVPVTLFDQALMALAKEWNIITHSSDSEIHHSN
jgi:hypothetical protein